MIQLREYEDHMQFSFVSIDLSGCLNHSGADKSRFWPNRALWGRSMKLGTIMV